MPTAAEESGHQDYIFVTSLGIKTAFHEARPRHTAKIIESRDMHGRLDIKTAFHQARPRHIAKIIESRDMHGWLIAVLLREMSGLEGKAMFECVESSFNFNRQGSVEAPGLWQMMAVQLLASVEGKWKQKNMGLLLDLKVESTHQMCSDLIEEAEKWDLVLNLQVCGGQTRMRKKKDLKYLLPPMD